jgi:hypothetical protein
MDPIVCSVAQNSGKNPILFLPRHKSGTYGVGLPKGDLSVRANGAPYTASVMKIAINVMRDAGGANILPQVLRAWFGSDAGAPGKRARVQFRLDGRQWVLEPVTPANNGAIAA